MKRAISVLCAAMGLALAAPSAHAGEALPITLIRANAQIFDSPYFKMLAEIQFPLQERAAAEELSLNPRDDLFFVASFTALAYLDYTRNYEAAGLYAGELAMLALEGDRPREARFLMHYARNLPVRDRLVLAHDTHGREGLQQAVARALGTLSNRFDDELSDPPLLQASR